MTAAQKKARDNFKKAALYRKRTGCSLKEAFNAVKKGVKINLKKKSSPKTKVTSKQGKLFGIKSENISHVFAQGKKILLDKLGKLEAKKFITSSKLDKRKIQKEITTTKSQLRKLI